MAYIFENTRIMPSVSEDLMSKVSLPESIMFRVLGNSEPQPRDIVVQYVRSIECLNYLMSKEFCLVSK